MGEKLMENQGYFNKFACTDALQGQLLVTGDKDLLLFPVQGGYLAHGKFYNLFLDEKG